MSLSRAQAEHHDDDRELRSFGYEPQLNRSMGLFSSLSISISCMCITAGIFTVYAYSLGTVGPAFIWTWPIVALGQIVVALVLADLAGRIPLSGYAFQWTSRLVNSHYGWFTGWAGLMAFTPDRLPIVDAVPSFPGTWVGGGFSGHGMVFGPRLGQLLAEAVTAGNPPTSLAPLRLDRPTLQPMGLPAPT